jgi:glycosyltransferase involved in cell wall biosynthesis
MTHLGIRVLMVIPVMSYFKGKPQYSAFISREMEALQKAGIEVFAEFLNSRSNPITLWRFSVRLSKIVRDKNIDLIHVQTGTAGLFLLFSAFKIPSLVTIGGSELLGYPGTSLPMRMRGKIASNLSKAVCRRVDQVLVVSENLAKALPPRLSKPPLVIPRAVNTNFFKPIDKHEARIKLNWEQNKKYIAFSDPRPHMKVKNRALANQVIRLVAEKTKTDIELAVIYQKTPDQVKLMLNAADALLVTSLHEGSPNIVKEAMACNLPVVSVPCGDVRTRLKGVVNSEVVSYNHSDLADVLIKVLEMKSRSNGRYMLKEQGLTTESFINIMQSIYRELIKDE